MNPKRLYTLLIVSQLVLAIAVCVLGARIFALHAVVNDILRITDGIFGSIDTIVECLSYSSWFLPYEHSTSVLLPGRELGIRNFPVWAITRK